MIRFNRDSAISRRHWRADGAIIGAVARGVFGTAPFLFAPFLVGGLISAGWTESTAGLMLTLELAAAAVGSATTLVPRLRLLPATALLLALAADLSSALVLHFALATSAPFAITRMMAGLGEGVCLAATYERLSRASSPDRLFALLLVATLLVSALGLWMIPAILQHAQLPGLFVCLAIAALGLAISATKEELPPMGSVSKIALSRAVTGALLTIVLFFGAQGMVWAFIEEIGAADGITHGGVGRTLAASSIAGLAAALAAMSFAGRWGQRAPIALTTALSLPLLGLLAELGKPLIYIVAACGLQACWCFATPYVMAGLAELDDNKHVIALGVSVQLVGFGVGPAIGGTLVEASGGYGALLYLAAAMSLISMLLAVLVYRRT